MRIKCSKLPELSNLTNREMDLFLYLARRQDLSGFIPGVHNQDVCRQTGMCKQSFYTTLRSLSAKRIISILPQDNDYDVQITGNDFSYEGAFKEGYVNLHREVFHQTVFKNLKANEKYLLFELLKRTHENSSSYKVGKDNLYKVLQKLVNVTKRVLRGYMHSLRYFFSIGIRNGLYFITYKHSVFHTEEKKGVEQQEFEYFIQVSSRRAKIKKVAPEKVASVAQLLKQYRNAAAGCGVTLTGLKSILAEKIAESVANRKQNTSLNIKYIHKLLKETIDGMYQFRNAAL